MLQAVFHHGLKQHAGHKRLERLVVNLFNDFQIVFAEPRDLNVQVVIDELQFFLQRHKGFVLTEQPPKDIA